MPQSLNPNIILVQETMCTGENARSTLESWLKNWSFSSIDAEGQTRVLIMRWSTTCKALLSSSFCNAISVKLMVKNVGFSFSVVNIYDPYIDRVPYWEDLANAGALNDPLNLVGGDLNFTLSHR
jgi:hypothetical protein